jgi:hypothetical protein
MTASCWPFSTAPTLASTLETLSQADNIRNGRFPARNFRLEWQLPQSRIENYTNTATIANAVMDPSETLKWLNRFHNQYLARFVQAGARMDKFDTDSTDCPEPFRLSLGLDEFGHSEDGLFLVRLEDLDIIARDAQVSKNELREVVNDVAVVNRQGVGDRSREQEALADILRQWQERLDNRPIFAGYWDDAQSVLADPQPGWAEELRDRLGLLHYDPTRKPDMEIDVVVFRYPVRLIPRYSRSGPRLLLRPTVLDGSLSEAFCTAPAGTGVGSTIDLAGRDDIPWQEVIHPPIEYKPEHAWAVDSIKACPSRDLGHSRAIHLIKLCLDATLNFQELCNVIDGDLI